MTADIKQLAERIQKLPPGDRAFLAEKLIASLEDDALEDAWKAEVISRRDEIRAGAVDSIPSEEVYRQIDALLAE